MVVNVSAEAQTLNTTDASLGNSMNNTLIQALPSEGRNVPDLLSLQPGVLYLGQNSGRPSNPSLQNDPRSGAVNGGRSDQGNITVDGLDDNDQVNGYAFTGVLRETQDSVEEFRVTTGLADADQGRSSGAQVSMVTKSGTNKFHGAAYEYNRPTLTVANDWFNKAAQVSSGEPNIPPKLIRNSFGGARGRPYIQGQAVLLWELRRPRVRQRTRLSARLLPPPATSRESSPIRATPPPELSRTTSISPSQIAALDGRLHGQRRLPLGSGPQSQRARLPEPVSGGQRYLAGRRLNTGSFTFSSPTPVTLNTSIARIDFTPGQKHRIFVRGNLQKDTTAGTEQFPGQGPSYVLDRQHQGHSRRRHLVDLIQPRQ